MIENQKIAPPILWRRDERHGRDQLIVTLYQEPDGDVSFSVQARLGSMIRAAFPSDEQAKCSTPEAARFSAARLLAQWTQSNPAAKARLKAFDQYPPAQRELFPELDNYSQE